MNRHLPISGTLSEFDFASILALMNSQSLDGQLKIATARFSKTLWLENGRIVFAQSSLAEDSLGQFLLSRGIIDKALFAKSRSRMQKNKTRHGRALLEMGALTPEHLWTEVAAHLRAIVFSIFTLRTGKYDIGPLPENESENIVLDVPIPVVILDGIRCIEDQEFIESRFAENNVFYPAPPIGHFPITLKPFESHILSLVAEATPLAAVVQKSELLRFDTLKILYSLLKLELICDRRQPTRQPTPHTSQQLPTTFTSFDETLQYYNAKFEYIYRVLSKEIGPVAHSILFDSITAILESIHPCFQNLEICGNGRIDEKSVMKSIWYENFNENSNEFLKGLEEILYAELYAVKRHLGKDHEKLILRWIRESGN
ncbi:MAG TPA: DUF4388 domain-containing protein [Patescibacteria group bacterium]|nr:DUF4388 domain-containing protein [Patescibacteria group bacterium]